MYQSEYSSAVQFIPPKIFERCFDRLEQRKKNCAGTRNEKLTVREFAMMGNHGNTYVVVLRGRDHCHRGMEKPPWVSSIDFILKVSQTPGRVDIPPT